MPLLVIFIIISLAFYIFYKTKYFRSKLPIEKKWISSKSSISLGIIRCFVRNQSIVFISINGDVYCSCSFYHNRTPEYFFWF